MIESDKEFRKRIILGELPSSHSPNVKGWSWVYSMLSYAFNSLVFGTGLTIVISVRDPKWILMLGGALMVWSVFALLRQILLSVRQ